MNVQPPPLLDGMERVRWCIVVWSWRPRGPGARMTLVQTTGAIVFPDHASADKWVREAMSRDTGGYFKFQIVSGDPRCMGAGPSDWDMSIDHVYKAPGVSQ